MEEHRGLLGYSRERIEIDGGAHRVCIDGEGLELEAMDREALLVTGVYSRWSCHEAASFGNTARLCTRRS